MTTGHVTAAALIAAALAFPPLAVQAADTQQRSGGQATAHALSRDDMRHLQRLAEGNLAEIVTGKLAVQKAVGEDVRRYASRMIEDHGRMLDEQRALARSKSISLPAAPDRDHANTMKRLQSQSGTTFDRSYMTQMVKDHEDMLDLVQEIAAKAQDPDLKAAGEKAEPLIRQNLDMAKRIAATTELPDKIRIDVPRK